jgi:meso-butanediol dehydrogenase/(S,S)-butanediol dehydrogenase/diacetyl reductase
VNIGSSNALRNSYGQPAYGAAKSAAESLSASIAIEYGVDGIRSNTVHPGVIYPTGMTGPLGDHPDALDAYSAHIPMRRTGTPEEIAAVVAFLAKLRSQLRQRRSHHSRRRAEPGYAPPPRVTP